MSRYFCEPGIAAATLSKSPATIFSWASVRTEPTPPAAWFSVTPSDLVRLETMSGAFPIDGIELHENSTGSSNAPSKNTRFFMANLHGMLVSVGTRDRVPAEQRLRTRSSGYAPVPSRHGEPTRRIVEAQLSLGAGDAAVPAIAAGTAGGYSGSA